MQDMQPTDKFSHQSDVLRYRRHQQYYCISSRRSFAKSIKSICNLSGSYFRELHHSQRGQCLYSYYCYVRQSSVWCAPAYGTPAHGGPQHDSVGLYTVLMYVVRLYMVVHLHIARGVPTIVRLHAGQQHSNLSSQ